MKNRKLGWVLLGLAIAGVLFWSGQRQTYLPAWVCLMGGVVTVAVQRPDWVFWLASYLVAFSLLDSASIPTRSMLLAVFASLLLLVFSKRVIEWPRGSFWLAIMIVVSLPIATFSGSAGSAGGWADWLIAVLGVEGATAETVIWWVRKTLHFTVYGALAFAAVRSLVLSKVQRSVAGWVAVLWSMSHAGFDELKQLSIPGRTGSPTDLAIDLAGSIVAVSLAAQLISREPE